MPKDKGQELNPSFCFQNAEVKAAAHWNHLEASRSSDTSAPSPELLMSPSGCGLGFDLQKRPRGFHCAKLRPTDTEMTSTPQPQHRQEVKAQLLRKDIIIINSNLTTRHLSRLILTTTHQLGIVRIPHFPDEETEGG